MSELFKSKPESAGVLRHDVARCNGVGNDADGWREGCDTCLRRVAPRDEKAVMMLLPPKILVFECEHLIEGNDTAHTQKGRERGPDNTQD